MDGTRIAASTPMIAITTISSTSVKPLTQSVQICLKNEGIILKLKIKVNYCLYNQAEQLLFEFSEKPCIPSFTRWNNFLQYYTKCV